MRRWLIILLLGCGAAWAQPAPLNVFNWADYIDPAALERFQAATGIRIRYDVYDSLETLEARLSAGRSGYDVVVPTSEPSFARLVRAGALRPLDTTLLPNLAQLDAGLMARVAPVDPGNRHGVIYLWGTVGLGLREDRIAALAPDAPRDSWQLLLDPAHARRLAPCGIAVMDSATDVLPSILRALGRAPDSAAPADLAAAEAALHAIRPHLRSIPNAASLVDALANGELCLALTYSGDVIQAAARAREAGRPWAISYAAPREGVQLWFDMLAIPVDAPNPAAAHAFINFLLEPATMAGISNLVRYPNAVPAARALMRLEVAQDPSVYPAAAALAGAFLPGTPAPAVERARARAWARFRAGR